MEVQHHAITAGQNITRTLSNREQWEWEGWGMHESQYYIVGVFLSLPSDIVLRKD